jgi:hypothetical protein
MPRGKSAKSLALIWKCADILEEIQPATVRAVCYQLFSQGWIASMAKNETNKVGTQLVYAREEGLIPWSWIVDETRHPERMLVWDDLDECVEHTRATYRRDYWLAQSVHLEVWSEKGTVRGTLKPVLDEYQVTFRAMHGYTSATEIHNAAMQAQADDYEWVILYVGDWDPSGMNMSEQDGPGRLREYGAEEVIFRRLALQAQDHQPLQALSFPAHTKSQDPRYRWFVEHYGPTCWELDAMNPNDLRTRVGQAIADYIDVDAWEDMERIETVECDSLKEILGRWQDAKNKSRLASEYQRTVSDEVASELYYAN